MSEYLEKRKKWNRFWLWWNVIEGLVVLTAGVLAIVGGIQNSNTDGSIDNVLAYAIASFIVLDGIFRVVMFFVRYEKGIEYQPLIVAGFEVSLGTLLILIQLKHSGLLIESLVTFISIALMAIGALLLTTAVFKITKLHEKLVMPIAIIVLAAILVGVGVAIMILSNTQEYHNTLTMIMTGSTLSIVGAAFIFLAIFTARKDKKDIKKAEAEENGDYALVENKGGKPGKGKQEVTKAEPEIKDAEIIEPLSYDEPAQLEGMQDEDETKLLK